MSIYIPLFLQILTGRTYICRTLVGRAFNEFHVVIYPASVLFNLTPRVSAPLQKLC